MIKKQQKWIALLVICTFAWLLHVSAMPLSASGTTEKISSVNAENGPDHYEAVGQKAAPAKKKSILPWILIGVGVFTVTAVVLFVWPGLLKTKYDVTGSWVFVFTGADPVPQRQTDFTGTKESGTWIWPHKTNTIGTYTVDDKKLTMVPSGGDGWDRHHHRYVHVQGRYERDLDPRRTWNWTATRGTSPTSIEAPATQALGSED